MSNELEKFISENREAFDQRIPNPAVLDRINEQLKNATQKKKAVLIPVKMIRWAAACVLLAVGTMALLLLEKKATRETAPPLAQEQADTSGSTQAAPEIAMEQPGPVQPEPAHVVKIETEADADRQLASQKRAVFAKLQNMQSASQRIMAAEQVYKLSDKTDRDIVDALVKTMNEDPNTNVRLAALEALSKFHREPYVKKQLVVALEKQKDPLVQIELIQMLSKMKQGSILRELEKIVDDKNTIDAVKDHAYAGILHLKS